MERFNKFKGRVSLFLIAGILILCAGFAITGCGSSVLKVLNPQLGQCAVNLMGTAVLTLANANFPSIAGNNLTVEAWAKPGAPTSTASGIFSRFGSAGVALYVEGGMPKFAMRILPHPTSGNPNPTSTDYTLMGTTSLTQDIWYHLAAVVVNEAHTHPSSSTCTATVMAEPPHMDIYVDGVFENCATTWGNTPPDTATGPQGVQDPSVFGGPKDINTALIGLVQANDIDSVPTSRFQGDIDEVRLWTVARSRSDILACANIELTSTGSGSCSVDPTKLKGYWKMNECKGSDVSDWSGLGSAGGIETGVTPYTGAWVPGAPVVLVK